MVSDIDVDAESDTIGVDADDDSDTIGGSPVVVITS